MAAVTRFLVNYNLKRCFCTSTRNCAKNYANRQGKFLNKLMGSDGGKRKWYTAKERATVNSMVTEKLTSNHVTRRMTVLNKLFMQHITELMSSGEASTELIGRKIEVTHVKVTPDFQKVLVFWGSKVSGKEIETAEVLSNCAYRIRHELSQLRVIGQVPRIEFIKNRQLQGLVELENRMHVADYGEDFEPTIVQAPAQPVLTLEANLSPEVREKILKLEDLLEDEEEEEDDSKYDVDLPPMRHDVLGLDHSAIMNRVTASLKKAQDGAKNRLQNITSIYPSGNPLDLGDFRSSTEESEAFEEFLEKRQLQEKRRLRRENKESVLEYNLREHHVVDDENYDFHDDEKDIDGFEDINLESLK